VIHKAFTILFYWILVSFTIKLIIPIHNS